MQVNFIIVKSEAFIKGDNHVDASISRLLGHSSLICPLLHISEPSVFWKHWTL